MRVTDDGIFVRAQQDRVVDVLFDGRRIGSFWLERDTREAGEERLYPWPDALRRFLDGTTTLSLVDHVDDLELFSEEVALGEGDEERIRVEDANGNPLGLDKSLRLMRLFESRSPEHVKPLLDSMEAVLTALEQSGVEPFIAYGTLLGAVRDGELIGHDSDADLGYVSAHDHPADVILESFRLQRTLVEQGFAVTRYSGIAFKVLVEESDGARRGLDVFGGFMRDGMLYLMGEVGHPFRPEWVRPRSQVTLEGRSFPAPAAPEHLLEAMYGPTWQVPDPAYKFETPRSTVRRLNGWFRGTRVGREQVWDKFYSRGPQAVGKDGPSAFVRWVRESEPDMRTAVDVGCGVGRDATWLARGDVNAWGLDFVGRAFRKQARRVARQNLPARFLWANLSELRSVLVTGALLAREPGPRIVLARHVADATDETGRAHLLRLARMVAAHDGRLYVQVQTERTPEGGERGERGVKPLDVDAFLAQVRELGGRVLERHDLVVDDGDEVPAGSADPTICRLVITWSP
ncbi:class I SAM-dependent methyltransferase [Nocardioides koreensis]|uniref:class I SAM-dependent methyltransferase n=1 Tax=Nocardioides koreensis TaxID=433651 RepID=UPI0031DC4739